MPTKNESVEEISAKPGKLMTMIFTQKEGDDVLVVTKFHQDVSGRQLLNVFKTATRGMLQSAVKIGAGFQLSEDEILNYLFGE